MMRGIKRMRAVEPQLDARMFLPRRAKQERLWLANGEAAVPASLRWPLDEINVSSGFGLRSDPIAKPVATTVAITKPTAPAIAAAKPVATATNAKNSKNKKAAPVASTATGGPVRPGPVVIRRALLMHQGVDFAAEPARRSGYMTLEPHMVASVTVDGHVVWPALH